MAAAVGQGGVEGMYGVDVLVINVAVLPPTEKALFICVRASWALS